MVKRIAVIFFIFVICTGAVYAAQEWYQGGTLHNCTVREWRTAEFTNKLATSGDWLAATTWKGELRTRRDLDRLRVASNNLVKTLEFVIYDNAAADNSETSSLVALLLLMTDEFNPEYY